MQPWQRDCLGLVAVHLTLHEEQVIVRLESRRFNVTALSPDFMVRGAGEMTALMSDSNKGLPSLDRQPSNDGLPL
jgi:hypothetical protein